MKRLFCIFVAALMLIASATTAQSPVDFGRDALDLAIWERMYLPKGFNPDAPVTFRVRNDFRADTIWMYVQPTAYPIGVGPGGSAVVKIWPGADEPIQPSYWVGREPGRLYLALNTPAEERQPATSRVLEISRPVAWPGAAEDGCFLENNGSGWAYYLYPHCDRIGKSGLEEQVVLHPLPTNKFVGDTVRTSRLISDGYLLVGRDQKVVLYNDNPGPTGCSFSVRGIARVLACGEVMEISLKKGIYVCFLNNPPCEWWMRRFHGE